jgi:hypothetical protein
MCVCRVADPVPAAEAMSEGSAATETPIADLPSRFFIPRHRSLEALSLGQSPSYMSAFKGNSARTPLKRSSSLEGNFGHGHGHGRLTAATAAPLDSLPPSVPTLASPTLPTLPTLTPIRQTSDENESSDTPKVIVPDVQGRIRVVSSSS